MKMTIKGVRTEEGATIVRGSTAVGEFSGVWRGGGSPCVGEGYYFELTTGELSVPIHPVPSKEKEHPRVFMHDDEVTFIGRCEGMDEEVYYVRLAMDWIEMVEICGKETISIGDYVSFSATYSNVEIYTYSYS